MQLRLTLLTFILSGSLVWAQNKQIAVYQQQVASVGPLTDALVLKYIATQKALQENGAQFTSHMAGQNKQKDGHKKFGGIVQSAGFSDYAEFLKVNARVAWAFNMVQGQLGIDAFDKQYEDGMKQFDEGIAQYDEQLANPEVPEDTKKELRKARAQLVAGKAKVTKEFQKNKKYAKLATNKLAPLSNKEDTEVVLRHETELRAIFSGLTPAQMQKIQDATAGELRNR